MGKVFFDWFCAQGIRKKNGTLVRLIGQKTSCLCCGCPEIDEKISNWKFDVTGEFGWFKVNLGRMVEKNTHNKRYA